MADADSPVITENEWEEAKRKLAQQYGRSNQLEACLAMLKDFESVYPVKKYKSDWKTYLAESRFEDFVRVGGESIYEPV